jgi:YidC/Oxa1 family membrane protein insertase
VFLALLHVLRYFNRPGLTFEQNAAIPNYVFGPAQVRSFLEARLFGAPLSAWIRMPQDLLDSFGGHVDRVDVVVVAVPLMVLAAVATHLTARASLRQQATAAPVEAAAGPTDAAMRIMRATPWIFPLGVLLGGLVAAFPIAILLYWLTNNLWTLVQQRIVFRRLAAEEAAHPVPVAPVAPEPVEPVEPPPPLRPGAKPVTVRPSGGAARRPTNAATRTGGKAAAGRRSTARRR